MCKQWNIKYVYNTYWSFNDVVKPRYELNDCWFAATGVTDQCHWLPTFDAYIDTFQYLQEMPDILLQEAMQQVELKYFVMVGNNDL